MKILIYTLGNHDVGMGHIYRMMNLADVLHTHGHRVVFLIPSIGEGIIKVQKRGYETIQIPTSSFERPDEYEKNIPQLYDCIIVDALNVSEKIMLEFRNKSKFLISFDNTGNGRILADVLINILYRREPYLHTPQQEYHNYDYLLLHSKFAEYNQKPKFVNREVKNILIAQGGADTYGLIPQILDNLKVPTKYNFHILIGPAFQHNSALQEVISRKKITVVILTDITEPWKEYYPMDLAITGGGMTLFELLCIGVPCIALTGEPKEIETINALESEGMLCNFGFYRSDRAIRINDYIEKISSEYNYRKELTERGRELIDGNGCERIVRIIEKAIEDR